MNEIYLRTSTAEQSPILQLDDIRTSFNVEDYQLLEEKQSAYDDNKHRPIFNMLQERIIQGKVSNLYVWDLDRIYRNRNKLVQFLSLCRLKKVQVYSYNQKWLTDLHSIPPPFNEIMYNLLTEVLGWIAESESTKKSNRVKMAIRQSKDGETVSYKGNKWGRKALSKQTITKIIELHNGGHSLRKISDTIKIYDSNNNARNISKSSVHKTIRENEAQKVSLLQRSLFDELKNTV
jgi:DNA invertase Pin-like site-specific DNA recombinase